MNKSIIYKAKEDKDIQEDLRKLEALQKELKTLQQEPCEDCISREHLLEEIASLKESPWFKDDTNCAMAIRKEAIEIVEDLCIRKEPSVNPQKIGHWIVGEKYYMGERNGCCSVCEDYYTNDWFEMKYCPNCGAKMVEPQESEESEWIQEQK